MSSDLEEETENLGGVFENKPSNPRGKQTMVNILSGSST